jgi:hypothetical protein
VKLEQSAISTGHLTRNIHMIQKPQQAPLILVKQMRFSRAEQQDQECQKESQAGVSQHSQVSMRIEREG